MVREYEGRTQEEDQIKEIEDSKRSPKIYEKAYACYRPEFGESNAESAERHELIAAKVLELTEQRKGKQKNKTRIQNHFQTANEMQYVIDNKQTNNNTQRKTHYRSKCKDEGSESTERQANSKSIHKQHSKLRS